MPNIAAPFDEAQLARAVTERLYRLRPEFVARYGARGREKCSEDIAYHTRHLADALWVGDEQSFLDYVAWAAGTMVAAGVAFDDIVDSFEQIRAAAAEELPDDVGGRIGTYIAHAIARGPSLADPPACELEDATVHGRLAREYIELILADGRTAAERAIIHAFTHGMPLREIYALVLLPAQREIGRRWQTREITVAQEHICTLTTQRLMGRLSVDVLYRQRPRNGLRALCLCPPGERHDMGIRAFADLLEAEGWDAHCLGADMPLRSIADAAKALRPDVVAVSASLTLHLRSTAEAIAAARAGYPYPARVIVGGRAFTGRPHLAEKVGADACPDDLTAAVETLRRVQPRYLGREPKVTRVREVHSLDGLANASPA